ncbi:GINS subunit [Trypanosoma melophagium]|uniref:GINS subunit n=1 Tax=Trypanosoma melophagium TaxID=715481 RepID=UPI00351A3280|nr:GINS subunit [Trypanosoma melophagium]
MSGDGPTSSSWTSGNPTSVPTTTTLRNTNNSNGSHDHHINKNKSDAFTVYHFASFAAMEVTVTMIPRFTMPRVSTAFGGRYGPFTPNHPVEVPLWLALHIRQTDTCTISPPPFLAVSFLRDVLEREKANDATFEALPFYFFEVVKQLCEGSAAAEDIPHVAEVVRLVAEVKATRRRKLQRSMAVFEAEGSPVFIPGIKLTNIVHHELEFLRVSFAVVLRQAAEMHRRREHRVGAVITTGVNGTGIATATNAHTIRQESQTPTRVSSGMGIATDGSGSAIATPSITATTQLSAEQMMMMTTTTTRGRGTTSTITTTTEQQQHQGEPSLYSHTPTGATGTSASSLTDATETLTNVTDDVLSPPVKKRRTLRQT